MLRCLIVILSCSAAASACADTPANPFPSPPDGGGVDAATDTRQAMDSGAADSHAPDTGSADSGAQDGGGTDASAEDSGRLDGGPGDGAVDSGPTDSATDTIVPMDAGQDSGNAQDSAVDSATDTGSPDTGSPDTGTGTDTAPMCPAGAEICDDNCDNDGDGMADCADSDCASQAGCQEICNDTIDNNRDGRIDCNDPMCTAFCSPGCPDGDLGSALGTAVIADDTTSAGDDSAGTCGGTSSPELAYQWTAPSTGTFNFFLDSLIANYDTVLYVRDGGCSGNELGCSDDTLLGDSSVSVDLVAGQQVLIFVDGYDGAAGTFELAIAEF